MDIKDDNIWKSCCNSSLDRRAIIYFSRLTISFVVIIFCLYKLITNDDCDTFGRYSSLLTFIIGLNFPSVKMNK
jgi:hypothetical protein